MSITSTDICQAADALKGFVGFNRKTGRYIVRFSEDSFGVDVADDSITPTSEFVWSSVRDDVMRLGREQLQILLEQNINERLNIGEPLLVYLRRQDLPEITAQRQLLSAVDRRPRRALRHALCWKRPPPSGAADAIGHPARHAGAAWGGERHEQGTEREEGNS